MPTAPAPGVQLISLVITLTLHLHEPATELGGISEIMLTWADTPENGASIEAGAFRVLGDTMSGGNA